MIWEAINVTKFTSVYGKRDVDASRQSPDVKISWTNLKSSCWLRFHNGQVLIHVYVALGCSLWSPSQFFLVFSPFFLVASFSTILWIFIFLSFRIRHVFCISTCSLNKTIYGANASEWTWLFFLTMFYSFLLLTRSGVSRAIFGRNKYLFGLNVNIWLENSDI